MSEFVRLVRWVLELEQQPDEIVLEQVNLVLKEQTRHRLERGNILKQTIALHQHMTRLNQALTSAIVNHDDAAELRLRSKLKELKLIMQTVRVQEEWLKQKHQMDVEELKQKVVSNWLASSEETSTSSSSSTGSCERPAKKRKQCQQDQEKATKKPKTQQEKATPK